MSLAYRWQSIQAYELESTKPCKWLSETTSLSMLSSGYGWR